MANVRARVRARLEVEDDDPRTLELPRSKARTRKRLDVVKNELLVAQRAPQEPTPGLVVPRSAPIGRIRAPMPEWDRGSGPYVQAHPTHYKWAPGPARAVDRYLNHPLLRGKISICNYDNHPPILGHDFVDAQYVVEPGSFDVWAKGGRGHPLTEALRKLAFRIIFRDPLLPLIDYIISGGGMWTPELGWEWFDPPEDGSDPGHHKHIHCSLRFLMRAVWWW